MDNSKSSFILDDLISSVVNEVQEITQPIVEKQEEKVVEDKPKKSRKKAKKEEVKEVVQEEILVYAQEETLPAVNETPKIEVPKVTQDDIFTSFINAASGMNLTPAELSKVSNSLTKLSSSHSNAVRFCNSDNCSIVDACPFTIIKKYPTGELCPVDKCMADYAFVEYERFVREQTNNIEDPLTYLEIATIRELVACDIEEFRQRGASNNSDVFVQQPIFVVKDTSQIVYADIENPIYNIRERTARRKDKLLQRLLLTPESRARFKLDGNKQMKKDSKSIIDTAEAKIKTYLQDVKDGKSK